MTLAVNLLVVDAEAEDAAGDSAGLVGVGGVHRARGRLVAVRLHRHRERHRLAWREEGADGFSLIQATSTYVLGNKGSKTRPSICL